MRQNCFESRGGQERHLTRRAGFNKPKRTIALSAAAKNQYACVINIKRSLGDFFRVLLMYAPEIECTLRIEQVYKHREPP